MRKSYTTEEFIQKAKLKHGDRFGYDLVDYKYSRQKVCIVCNEKDILGNVHGEFMQEPAAHLRGQGCPKCSGMYATTELFIAKAREIHGNKYDYSKSEFKGVHKKVCIICPEHGEFWQEPNAHLQGIGCVDCAGLKKLTKEEFIRRARQVHGWRYDYSKVVYINSYTKVCIICPEHKEFWQEPLHHLAGHGCPNCKQSKGEEKVDIWLKENKIKYVRQYRIVPDQALFSRNTFKVDFYLPNHNIIIEYHGQQHYQFVPYWHKTIDNLHIQQDRDKRLREYCKRNDITLIEIPYTMHNKISQILSKKIRSDNQ